MKDIYPLSYFLCIVVSRNNFDQFLSHKMYASARMYNYHPLVTQVASMGKFSAESSEPCVNPTLYPKLPGSLIFSLLNMFIHA